MLARQAHYKELQKAFGGVGAELRKDAPDKAVLAAAATTAAGLAKDLPTWFPKGSGPEAGVKTAAKAEIWTDAAGFAAAVTKLQDETAKAAQSVARGWRPRAPSRRTVPRDGESSFCKNCHDQYPGSA